MDAARSRVLASQGGANGSRGRLGLNNNGDVQLRTPEDTTTELRINGTFATY
jgi:hypothetical protein